MFTKKNTRVTFRSNKRSNFKRNTNFSNGKLKNKGNVTQQYNKYLKLAKEASSSGDRIQSEYYYQFTDHYYRLMTEMGITLEDTDSLEDRNSDLSSNQSDKSTESETLDSLEEKKDENSESDDDIESIESIESIPFISKPIKKKTVKIKKTTV